ncbi:hypothetical protein [Gemmatimonas phototrophica]|uniref:Uncharacterized protein n=1 Tax=Gemmatimonas phototrophica TaxID=1379270 RepID=A0A143BLF4_9BACT|nr:hypothetical protein [Gemmatimonas phototrophica]AMW05838.1 hypothetical protein GEMMAAP_15650 [Gemmatimonas phototrophica]
MSRFFPRDVVHWGEEKLHPLRAFAIRTIEPAGITGLVLRVWRTIVLGSGSWIFFVSGLTVGVLFLCGMLTWHLGNYPVKRWPLRAFAFFVIECAVEMGMSSVLIVFGRERYGSQLATWGDWWPMAGQALWQRGLTIVLFTLILAVVVQLVRRAVDQRRPVHATPN